MDKVLFDLIGNSLILVSLFSFAGNYRHKHLNSSFWDENPHKVKASFIDPFSNTCFLAYGLLGLLVSVIGSIINDDCVLPSRLHSIDFYFNFFLLATLLFSMSMFLLLRKGKELARSRWTAALANIFYSNLDSICFVLEIKNAHYDNFSEKHKNWDADSFAAYRRNNIENSKKSVETTLKYFDLSTNGLSDIEKANLLIKVIDENYSN